MTGGSYHLWQRTTIIVAVVNTMEDRVSKAIVRGGREAGSVPPDVSCRREESERDESRFERPCLRLRRYRNRAVATTINNAAKTPNARPTAAPAGFQNTLFWWSLPRRWWHTTSFRLWSFHRDRRNWDGATFANHNSDVSGTRPDIYEVAVFAPRTALSTCLHIAPKATGMPRRQLQPSCALQIASVKARTSVGAAIHDT